MNNREGLVTYNVECQAVYVAISPLNYYLEINSHDFNTLIAMMVLSA
jgi:hypothetical protein